MTFLVTPKRMSDESARGHMHRVAEANALSFRVASNVSRASGGEFSSEFGQDSGNSPFLSVLASRFCPGCLAAAPYWRRCWDLAFVDACPTHGNWLSDACGACGSGLSWDRPSLHQCRCGAVLAAQKVAEAPPSVIALSGDLQDLLTGQPATRLAPLSSLNLDQAARLVRLIGTYGTSDGRLPQKVQRLESLATSWPISSYAAEVLATWPRGFDQLLDRLRRQASAGDEGSLPRVFRGLYVAIYRSFDEPAFEFLRAAFADYVARHWPRLAPGRNRRIRQDGDWVTLAEAAKRLGISAARTRDMVQRGALMPASQQRHGTRLFTVFRSEDIADAAKRLPSSCSLTEAARRLGLTRARLRRLVGPLSRIACLKDMHGGGWCVDNELVEDLEKCLRQSRSVKTIQSDSVSLDNLLRFSALPDAAVARLLLDLASGALAAGGRLHGKAGVGALVLAKESVALYRPQRLHSDLSVPEAAEELHIKQEVAYFLVRQGMLKARRMRGTRRDEWRVGAEQLAAFQQDFVLGRDLALAFGTSSRSIQSRLARAGVHPCSGPAADGGRQSLYRRIELESSGFGAPPVGVTDVVGVPKLQEGFGG